MMIIIEIQYRSRSRGVQTGFHGTPLFASDRPLINCQKSWLKSVYYYTKRFYNKTLTLFTSKSLETMSSFTNMHKAPLKIITILFVLETNTGNVGGFNITGEWIFFVTILNPGLWKLQTIHWSHHVPTTKSTPFVVSEDEWDTKEGPGKSMKNALCVLQCVKRHI